MLKICGKAVRFQGKQQRKTIAQLSPVLLMRQLTWMAGRVKARHLHNFTFNHPQHLSTPIIAPLPLGEHYFYPVSTAPTITFTKGKRKKGSI